MGNDDYVIDEYGAWAKWSDAIAWYRGEVTRLRAVEAKCAEHEAALEIAKGLLMEGRYLELYTETKEIERQRDELLDLLRSASSGYREDSEFDLKWQARRDAAIASKEG